MTEIEKVVARALVGAGLYDHPAPDGATVFLDILREAGYVVVPREPTEAMIEAAEHGYAGHRGHERCDGYTDLAEVYCAMIAAAETEEPPPIAR